VLTVVLLAIQIFWDVKPCRRGEQLQDWLTLLMTALRSFQTSVNIYQSHAVTPQEYQKFSVRYRLISDCGSFNSCTLPGTWLFSVISITARSRRKIELGVTPKLRNESALL
jgi:hypothetical protein